MTELVLKRFEIHRLPKTFAIGFGIGWDTFFQNYQYKNKVRWLSLTVSFIFWMIVVRVPTKIYGLRAVSGEDSPND